MVSYGLSIGLLGHCTSLGPCLLQGVHVPSFIMNTVETMRGNVRLGTEQAE